MKSFATIAFSAAALLVADAYALGSCTGFEVRAHPGGDNTDMDIKTTGLELKQFASYQVYAALNASTDPCSRDSATWEKLATSFPYFGGEEINLMNIPLK